MTKAERVKLLDAAMRSRSPTAFLAGVRSAFEQEGRTGDAVVAAVLKILLRTDEIETVLRLRAEWSGKPEFRAVPRR